MTMTTLDSKSHSRIERREIVSECIISFEATTNGYKGGDAGHGGVTAFSIANEGGAFLQFVVSEDGERMTLYAGGDAELRSLVGGLRWIADTLERQAKEASGK